MNLKLENRKALVTGSTAGIGFAIARGLAQEGASVIITGRTQPRVDGAIKSILKEFPGAKVTSFAGDLASAPAVPPAVSGPCRRWISSSTTSAFIHPRHSRKLPMTTGMRLSRRIS